MNQCILQLISLKSFEQEARQQQYITRNYGNIDTKLMLERSSFLLVPLDNPPENPKKENPKQFKEF